MQKRAFIIILTCFLFCLGIGFFFINEKRYEITSPMQDLEYKKSIIQKSGKINYKLKNLDSLVGPNELLTFIKENDEKPDTYTPSPYNIKNGIFHANLHCHSTKSDGVASVEFLLTQAEGFAQKNLNGKPMYIAITDHNTVLGAKEVINVLQKNPNKYKHVKVIAGIEIFTGYKTKYSPKPVEIHVLSWCINPYDKVLNKEFYKKNLKDKWNRTLPDRDFEEVISMMSEYGLVGIAHPARYLNHLEKDKEAYIKELIKQYKKNNKNNIVFLEGYYQAYDSRTITNKSFLKFINDEAKKEKVYRTGSMDTHGYNITKN